MIPRSVPLKRPQGALAKLLKKPRKSPVLGGGDVMGATAQGRRMPATLKPAAIALGVFVVLFGGVALTMGVQPTPETVTQSLGQQ